MKFNSVILASCFMGSLFICSIAVLYGDLFKSPHKCKVMKKSELLEIISKTKFMEHTSFEIVNLDDQINGKLMIIYE